MEWDIWDKSKLNLKWCEAGWWFCAKSPDQMNTMAVKRNSMWFNKKAPGLAFLEVPRSIIIKAHFDRYVYHLCIEIHLWFFTHWFRVKERGVLWWDKERPTNTGWSLEVKAVCLWEIISSIMVSNCEARAFAKIYMSLKEEMGQCESQLE